MGSVAAIWISGQPLSVASLVGFVTLTGMDTEWKKTDDNLFQGHDRKSGKPTWTATRVDLVFGSHSQLRALAEVYALLVYYHEPEADEASMPPKARDAWLAWYETTPDTPCSTDANKTPSGACFEQTKYRPSSVQIEQKTTLRPVGRD